jgi:hypothetical protein
VKTESVKKKCVFCFPVHTLLWSWSWTHSFPGRASATPRRRGVAALHPPAPSESLGYHSSTGAGSVPQPHQARRRQPQMLLNLPATSEIRVWPVRLRQLPSTPGPWHWHTQIPSPITPSSRRRGVCRVRPAYHVCRSAFNFWYKNYENTIGYGCTSKVFRKTD